MKGTTIREDLFRPSIEFAEEKNLLMDKLVAAFTDGAPCIIGKDKEFVALLREHKNRPILSFHCILHQEALCAQLCGKQFAEVMDVVTSVIKFIIARALNDHQFILLMDKVGNDYSGLLLHNNVRWL